MADLILPDEGRDAQRVEDTLPSLVLPPEADPTALFNAREATRTDPNKFAQARSLAAQVGLPTPTVERNFDEVSSEQKVRELQQLMAANPVYARQMRDPDFARLSADDAPRLTAIEKALDFTKRGAGSLFIGGPATAGSWLFDVSGVAYDAAARVAERFVPGPETGEWLDARARAARQQAVRARGAAESLFGARSDEGLVARGALSGLQSAGANLMLVPLGMQRAAVATVQQAGSFIAAAMATGVGAEAFTQAREKGKTFTGAALYAVPQAAFEYAFEVMPAVVLLKNIAERTGLMPFAWRMLRAEVPNEVLTTLAQNFNEWMNLNPEKPAKQWLLEQPSAVAQTIVATIVGVGVQTGALKAVQKVVDASHDQEDGKNNDTIKKLLQFAAESETRARAPATLAQFASEAAKDGPLEAVYVDAVTFSQMAVQAGINLQQAMPETAAALEDAITTVSDVRIPLGELLAAVPGTTLEQAIIPLIRVGDSNAPTQAELADVKYVEEVKAQTEKILAEHEFTNAWKESRDTVQEEILKQLNEVKRFTPEVNRAKSVFAAAIYASMASRMNLTPEQMYVRAPLEILARGLTGERSLSQQPDVQVNIGLDEGALVDAIKPMEVFDALKELGVPVLDYDIQRSKTENTFVGRLARALTDEEAYALSAKLRQEAIVQRVGDKGALHGPQKEKWGDFNAEFFKELPALPTRLEMLGGVQKNIEVLQKQLQGVLDKAHRELIEARVKQLQAAGEMAVLHQSATPLLPVHGVSTPKSVSVPAVHFSPQAGMLSLTTARYGAGLKGADLARVMEQPDARLKQRLHFYVPAGRGVRNEAGTGENAYGVTLNNLYDTDADPLRITARDATEFEQAVLDNGFAGYYARQSGAAVLLGAQSVPVAPLGNLVQANAFLGTTGAPAAVYDERRLLANELVSTPGLPAGRLTPAEWKKELAAKNPAVLAGIPAESFEGTEPIYLDQLARTFYQRAPQRDLIVQHNLTAENLLHAARMGGIPVPSLAVTKVDQPMMGFGEITLIGDAAMADPRGYARPRVFGADLYSPRYPDVNYHFDNVALSNLNKLLAPYRENVPSVRPLYSGDITSLQDLTSYAPFVSYVADKLPQYDARSYHGGQAAAEEVARQVGARERLYRGMTYSGKRRYTPHTLENVVKVLKRNLRGGESPSGNIYGVGQLRAKFTPQFKSIEGIRKAKGRLVSHEDFRKIKAEVDSDFFALVDTLIAYAPAFEKGGGTLADFVIGLLEDTPRIGFAAAAKQNGFENVSDEARQAVGEFMTRLRNLPTEYFEAKILREVDLAEFRGAVVPADTDQKVIDLLTSRGVTVALYARGDKERAQTVTALAKKLGENTLFQETPVSDLGLYSELHKQLNSAKLERAPAEQWKSLINSLANKGVKKEEIEFSGVMDWLDLQAPRDSWQLVNPDGVVVSQGDATTKARWPAEVEGVEPGFTVRKADARITKQDVLDYLEEHGTRVNEEQFGGGEGEIDEEAISDLAQRIFNNRVEDEARENTTKYDVSTFLESPTYRVVELPPDMFRSETRYGLQNIEYPTVEEDEQQRASDFTGEPTAFAFMPDKEFASHGEAADYAVQQGLSVGDKPYWRYELHDGSETFLTSLETYKSEEDAQTDGEAAAKQAYDNDVQDYIDNASPDDSDYEDAERQLREDGKGTTDARHEGEWQSKGGTGYTELVQWVPGIESFKPSDKLHFGDVGGGRTVVWERVKEHGTALFVEEVQSKRAQVGREEGFRTRKTAAEVDRLNKEQDEALQAFGNFALDFNVANDVDISRNPASGIAAFRSQALRLQSPAAIAALPTAEALHDRYQAARQAALQAQGAVPAAPFVTETKSWVALAMKRMIRHAIDNGLEEVAWTQGEQQVLRYQNALRQRADRLQWKKTEGGVKIEAFRNERPVKDLELKSEELRAAIGKPMAERILSDENQEGAIIGDDIVIDDLGMAAFYGDENGLGPDGKPSIMTQVANKIIKQYGGKVGALDVPTVEGSVKFDRAPGFKITPELKVAAARGFSMFQPARGQITFAPGGMKQPTALALLADANLSTFFHEMGHFYLELLTEMATQREAPAEVIKDLDRILNWFGLNDNLPRGLTPAQHWRQMSLADKRTYHEQFARGVEAYLFEGKAPSPELQPFFHRFRTWMLNVYRMLTGGKPDSDLMQQRYAEQLREPVLQLTDEVRGVMDRMLATNEEITAAETARSYFPLFDAKPEGMSEAEWREYQALGADATQEAVDLLQTRSLRDMRYASGARARVLKQLQREAAVKRKGVRSEVAAEVFDASTPDGKVYQAMRGLRKGWTQDDGSTIKLKFSTTDLQAMYPENMTERPDLSRLRGMTHTKDGVHPDQVAALTGFGSGDELVRKLIEAESPQERINGLTDQRMLERYGDLADPASMERAADEAVHNDVRGHFVATELHLLEKAVGERRTLTKAAKDYAIAMVARKRIRDIKPHTFAVAEARAAKNAEKARTANKLAEAAAAKRTQIVNLYAAKAAHEALTEVEKNVAYLKRVGDSGTLDPAYREQIEALLERFELRKVSVRAAARRHSLTQWIEAQRAAGHEPVIDPALENETLRKPYQDMALEDFRGLVDSVKNIEHLGRLKHKLLTLADKRAFAVVVEDAVTSVEANAKRTLPVKLERNTWTDKMKDGVSEYFAMHRKFSIMLREFDGWQDNGVMWRLFGRSANAASDAETTMHEQMNKRLTEIFRPIFAVGKTKEKLFIPAINASLSREGRLLVALNTGSEGNLQRLMDGDHWTQPQVQAILDTLTKPEMDFVQSVWDYVGEFKQRIGEQQRRLTGVEPAWVEPRTVQTVHGEYAGGYFPAKYDATRSTRSLADEAVTSVMDQWRGARGAPAARASFTKERADKVVDRPLRKDFGVVFQHLTEVSHRLAWQEYLVDANRLLRAAPLDNAIRTHYGPEVLQALRKTLEDVAAGVVPAQNAFERGVNYIRTGATVAGLGWRLTTSLLQPFGLTQSIVRVGSKWIGKGLVEWLGDAARMENTAKRIYEKSAMMRHRGLTMQREISEVMNRVEGKNTAIKESFFYLIQKMQLVADIPTWLGQYSKAVEGGADEANAIAQADQAVRDAQGTGDIHDLPEILRGGPLLKLWTNFASFFVGTTQQIAREAIGRVDFEAQPVSATLRLAADFLLLFMIPALLGSLMKWALGDEDEEKLLRTLAAEHLNYMLGTFIGLREVGGAVRGALGLPGDYGGPAGLRLFTEVAKLGKQIGQGEIDEAAIKALNSTGGVLFHYPAGQINATFDGILAISQGKTDYPGVLLVGSSAR